MHKKALAILVIVFSVLLSVWLVGPAFACEFRVHKFNDVNSNGVQDEGEEDLADWAIRLYRETWGGGWELVAEGVTGPDGEILFAGLIGDRTWRVWEAQVECWEPTTPVSDLWLDGYYIQLYAQSGSFLFEFGNVYTCNGVGQGCTPGYWRNLAQHGDEWSYDPYDDYFDDVFGCGPALTLNETIRARGGGLNKLLRFATAALLDAAHPEVDSGLTVEEVITMTCEALSSENWDIFDGFFDDETCPLD